MSVSGDVTRLLARVRSGERGAQEQLFELVYAEMRRLAALRMRAERPGHTLQATALVHEAYLRLLGNSTVDFNDRAHFFATVARTMRNILVDHARAAKAQKHGGGARHIELEENLAGAGQRLDQILAVDQALTELKLLSPRQLTVVEMRFFSGFTEEEVAEMLNISLKTVKRDWAAAKAWLMGQLGTADSVVA